MRRHPVNEHERGLLKIRNSNGRGFAIDSWHILDFYEAEHCPHLICTAMHLEPVDEGLLPSELLVATAMIRGRMEVSEYINCDVHPVKLFQCIEFSLCANNVS